MAICRGKAISMNTPVTALLRERKPRFLEGLEAPDVRTILAAGTQQRFLENSIIVNQGLSCRAFISAADWPCPPLLPDGKMAKKIVLLRVPTGEIFGEAAMLARSVDYLLSTEAIANSTTLVWSRAQSAVYVNGIQGYWKTLC